MARGVLDRMVRYMNANVVDKGESWRAYLLRLHADQLRSPEHKAQAAWTVGTACQSVACTSCHSRNRAGLRAVCSCLAQHVPSI